jgi:hypothetical protein
MIKQRKIKCKKEKLDDKTKKDEMQEKEKLDDKTKKDEMQEKEKLDDKTKKELLLSLMQLAMT